MSKSVDEAHRRSLEKVTEDGERWETLAGHLYDPASADGSVCPDCIVEYVAERYAFGY